jgi:hypothetical protein
MTLDHLKGSAREAVLWTPTDRIDFINTERWIGYGAATNFLAEMKDLIEHPRNLRMPCRALVGDPNNGKTMILRECIKRYPPEEDDDECHLPVLVFETPSAPSERRLYSEILKSLRVAHREDAPPEKLLAKVVDKCYEVGVRLLMADEFHNMLHGSAKDQRQFLASLKSLLNVLRVSFLAAGTHDIITALATDGQFVTRFEKLALPKWGLNNESRRLLASLEMTLPLAAPSGLANSVDLAQAIVIGGRGTIGGITTVTKKASICALKRGNEKIERIDIEEAVAQMREREVIA